MILANAEQAIVDIAKLRDYCLNPSHVEGKHKARVFTSTLGFTAVDAERLREMILAAVLTHEAKQSVTDEHGSRFTVDFETSGLQGPAIIRTAWIIDSGETVPRLISCYVKRN
jgi:hypothetical protein